MRNMYILLTSTLQRGQIFKIASVDAYVSPEIYTLVDLNGDPFPGKFYRQQLRLAPNANDPDFIFEIEKVLKKKIDKGKEYLLVKYLYYPGEKNPVSFFLTTTKISL